MTPEEYKLFHEAAKFNAANFALSPEQLEEIKARAAAATPALVAEVERLQVQNAEMLETLQSIGDKINNDFLDFADPSGLIYVPLNRAEIDTIRAAIASATADEAGKDE